MKRIYYGKCLPQDGKISNAYKLWTTCTQRLLCTSCLKKKSVFVFLAISYLCIYYEQCFYKNITDLHNHSHPEAAIFKTTLCSFWKVLVQRQKAENRQIFWSSLLTWCSNANPSTTSDLSLMGQWQELKESWHLSLRLFHQNRDFSTTGTENSSFKWPVHLAEFNPA
jgi:hypothetical protein